MVDQYPILTVIPPLGAIILAIATRRVRLSLGAGIVAAALLVTDLDVVAALKTMWAAFAGIFWDEGAVNTGNVYILLFLVLLGVLTSVVLMSGGSAAFSDWIGARIRSRRSAQSMAGGLGVLIFIDDYFNALAVGQIAKPVTDTRGVSRAKLAYIIDSTSAPVSVLMPFSSWGASIIGILAPIFAASSIQVSDVGGFLGAAAANFYAIAAIIAVFLVIYLRVDFGPMRREENRAHHRGEAYAANANIPGELSAGLPVHRPGAKRSLVVPFLVLVIGVIAAMFATGRAASGSTDPMEMLANTNVSDSLIIGAVAGLATALFYYARVTVPAGSFSAATLGRGSWEGAKSMKDAIIILLLAWMLGTVVGELGTGDYLGGLVVDSGMSSAWLVPLMFVAAAAMAFSTGTSWGSFGLLLPIAGDMLIAANADAYLVAALGAVLAGAVWGDHCSPISDTTILSATGAGCDVVTHVSTQLPYAITVGAAALAGYVVYAATDSVGIALVATLVLVVAALAVIGRATGHVEDHATREAAPAAG